MAFSKSTLLALLPFFLAATPSLAASTGKTTRYWDCCKPSCSWDGKATLSAGPVATCDKDDNPLADPNAVSACDGGSAYMCANESPWAVSDDLAYGYAAVSIAGGSESSWCCACYELTFTSGPVQGKKMIVQATNTGGDLGANHFDISVRAPRPLPPPPVCATNTTPTDPRRRLRHLQRLHAAVRHAVDRMGRAVRRRQLAQHVRRVPGQAQGRLLLALRLVRQRGQPERGVRGRRLP